MSLLNDIITNKEGLYSGDLRHYFKCLFNSRGAANPYHNIRHICTVLVRCYEGMKESQDILLKEFSGARYPGINNIKELNRVLLIAALFHDFQHFGRSGDDDINIEIAIRGLRRNILKEDELLLPYIIFFIESTEFGPAGHKKIAHSEYHKILRDADLTQICSDAWIRMVLFGLSQEMNVTPMEMLKMQERFLANLKFESQWGQKFNPIIKEKIQEAKELLEILQ